MLDNIQENFVNLLDKCEIKVHFFQEAKGITGIKGLHGKVVDDFSSKLGLSRATETVESIDADHRQMARCKSRSDSQYRAIFGVLKKFVLASTPSGDGSIPRVPGLSSRTELLTDIGQAVQDSITVLKEIHRNEKDTQCLQGLYLTNPRDDKKRIEETTGGLLQDAYCWVLDNSKYQQWRDNPDHGLLWVKGDPGKGKTMLLCGIINELQKSSPGTGRLSFFFCQATDTWIRNATSILRGLIYLLLDQQPSLIPHARKKYDMQAKHSSKMRMGGLHCLRFSQTFYKIRA